MLFALLVTTALAGFFLGLYVDDKIHAFMKPRPRLKKGTRVLVPSKVKE